MEKRRKDCRERGGGYGGSGKRRNGEEKKGEWEKCGRERGKTGRRKLDRGREEEKGVGEVWKGERENKWAEARPGKGRRKRGRMGGGR